jgi:hypothetical protein
MSLRLRLGALVLFGAVLVGNVSVHADPFCGCEVVGEAPPILMVECYDAGCWEFGERLCGCRITDCAEYEAGVLLTIDVGDCQ